MSPKPIFVISGGMGASARQVLDTVLAQFDTEVVTVVKLPLIRNADQVHSAVAQAAEAGGLIVHTLVDPALRDLLGALAAERGVKTVDLFVDLMSKLASHIGAEPLAHPGRFRELNQAYFERMEAIQFAMDHDDSQSADSLAKADIVLIGVSRSGKTPLTMYLAMQGWKVANVSFVPNAELPEGLAQVSNSRLVGLILSQTQLIAHRQRRQKDFGLSGATPYVSEQSVFEELESLRALFHDRRIAVIDVTNKPIESTARQVVSLIIDRLGDTAKQ